MNQPFGQRFVEFTKNKLRTLLIDIGDESRTIPETFDLRHFNRCRALLFVHQPTGLVFLAYFGITKVPWRA